MYFNPNQLPYDKILSLSNREILCEEHVKLITFLRLLIEAFMILKHTKEKHPLKEEVKYNSFRKPPCRFIHSLCENEDIPMRGKRIAPQQKKLLPVLPGSLYLKGICYPVCYPFNKLKWFSRHLNSKNNGTVLLFNTIFWH